MASKESYQEHLLKQIAANTGANIHDLRNGSHQEFRTDRVNQALNPQFIIYHKVTMRWNQCIAYHRVMKQR